MKLLRYISILCVSICVFSGIELNSVSAGIVNDTDLKLKLNNSFVLYSNQQLPYADANGRTLIPLRLIGDVMGANISWIGKEKKAIVSMGKNTISLVLGQKTAIVNGEQKQLDTMVVSKNSTIMVPARFISETFGIKVGYNKSLNVVQLTDPRILSSERLAHIDEMQNLNVSFNNMIVPKSVTFFKDQKNSINNKQIDVKVMNYSSQTIKKGRLNSNVLYFASESKLSFIGTRGMINMSDNNLIDIKPNGVYTDNIYLVETIDDEPVRYIFCNYFVN
ncbi:copper amine oxidase N-terminal domain-containing protein [Paenibacillus macquariensis]|uniref:Copper amine oxidase N-terminal domain-containing protein n=1 Tax=Paenibacillus macquariensis TaxID=948756 RepID=A0ABY1KDR6_9BACL|nr:copper amine oxidase N-terminal domain-containing protein [Paenibacillus macquariensis]MEC0093817.1 copper amine oxidase N-terminal domain-containing protein [Paenibacillus macquariensis]OAB33600.1 hypothetical protein PMSM_13300 [Paenibacillus macquariensis subsp. macquariensis]SIR67561.1 Copper amine oxidase N-terminal domain-containing protein [Paenibacillus macquariensis]